MPSKGISEIDAIFATYPPQLRQLMNTLRNWIHEVADEHGLTVEETIKWGEPSFRSEHGSPVRLGVKTTQPTACVYFNCQTSLVDTFRELYWDVLSFDGKRELTLCVNNEVPAEEVRHCLELALKYHQLKHLPQLGT